MRASAFLRREAASYYHEYLTIQCQCLQGYIQEMKDQLDNVGRVRYIADRGLGFDSNDDPEVVLEHIGGQIKACRVEGERIMVVLDVLQWSYGLSKSEDGRIVRGSRFAGSARG